MLCLYMLSRRRTDDLVYVGIGFDPVSPPQLEAEKQKNRKDKPFSG